MTLDFTTSFEPPALRPEPLGRQSRILRGFALPYVDRLLPAIDAIACTAPFRRMLTRGHLRMSAAMTNCGLLGWTSDPGGYRYTTHDPTTGLAWPPLPAGFAELANSAARAAGFAGFVPDACLLNSYAPGARMSLHQDRNETDFTQPIVSVSLGLLADFLFGGAARRDKPARVAMLHGDVVVWGGVDRLNFHGVAPVKPGHHAQLGERRINLTFRKAG